MSFSVMTCSPCFMAAMRNRGVQVQRRGDDDRLDAVLLGVLQQLLVRPVDLHVLAWLPSRVFQP